MNKLSLLKGEESSCLADDSVLDESSDFSDKDDIDQKDFTFGNKDVA